MAALPSPLHVNSRAIMRGRFRPHVNPSAQSVLPARTAVVYHSSSNSTNSSSSSTNCGGSGRGSRGGSCSKPAGATRTALGLRSSQLFPYLTSDFRHRTSPLTPEFPILKLRFRHRHAASSCPAASLHPAPFAFRAAAAAAAAAGTACGAATAAAGSPIRLSIATRARRGFLTEIETIKEEKAAGPQSRPQSVQWESPLDVVLYPDPRLRAPNRTITVFDNKLQQLADEMLDVMYKTDGVGLSAPQVGVNVRLMVYNPAGERGKGTEFILVNPRIVKSTKALDVVEEGCLSFPEIYADVERPVGVKVDAVDVRGKKLSLSLKGWQARIFQHEYDHLQATLFFDRMTPEVLHTIRPDLLSLEEEYEKRTQQKRPETVALPDGSEA